MAALSAILAHQGGWDEMLLVVGPIILIIGILAVVKRRVDRMGAAGSADLHVRAPSAQAGTRSMSAPTARRRPTRSS